MTDPLVTIITPTTGNKNLNRLIASVERQSVPYVHLLLWDDVREGEYFYPDPSTMKVRSPLGVESKSEWSIRYSIVLRGKMVRGVAAGSALRAVGLMAADTPYITFADTDVWYDDNHLESLIKAIEDKEWAYCVRKIWANEEECLGEDRFESVGDDSNLPYKLVDNSSLLVSRKFGASAACLYRETKEYNDDRLMFAFLKKYAGQPGITNMATVNQICPQKLEPMFRWNCTR